MRRFESHNDPDVPASKRQKKDITRTHNTTTSPYFSKSKSSKSSDIQETHIEGSHDDIYDILSTSSAGNVSLGAIGLDEYRRVLRTGRRGSGKGRRRRSQTSSNSVHQTQSDTLGAKLDVHQAPAPQSPNRNHRLLVDINSPDVLAFEQRPSTVKNAGFDASRYFNSKRDRPFRLAENAGPQIKRQKPSTVKEPIDLSEDELQADFAKYKGSNDGKNTASRNLAHSSRYKKATMRGDIHHTVFKTSSQRHPPSDSIAVIRAVCGKHIYERGDTPHMVVLRRGGKDGRRLESVLEDGRVAKDLSWLGIDLDQASYFGYSEAPSRYGYIMRSQSGDAGPKLFLKFESIDNTKDFCELLRSAKVEGRVMYVLNVLLRR